MKRHRRDITRRDFLNGTALAIGASLLPPGLVPAPPFEPEKDPGYYPPALTGLRGSHEGSYEVAHRIRDGAFWSQQGEPEDTGERYDLVVVGGGISGLAAAWLFRQRVGPKARILVLDNHDDFGGHAKRNEWRSRGGRLVLGYGGAQSLENPSRYSPVAKKLLVDIGVEVQRFYQDFDQKLYPSRKLGYGVFFDKERFGADRLVAGWDSRPAREFFADAPLPAPLREAIVRFWDSKTDYLPGLSPAAKRAKLAKTSYADFLIEIAGVPKAALPFFQAFSHDSHGVGIDALPTLDAWRSGIFIGGLDEQMLYPGLQGLGLTPDEEPEDPYIFHFPDGNAGVARLLVRALLTDALPGSTMEDAVLARLDYARLDGAGAPVRIRLNSTVVRTRQLGDVARTTGVEVAYVRGGRLQSVRADRCVLACWNGVIPYLCPELPADQKQALAYGVKVPLVYSRALVRNWKAWVKLGVDQVYAPGSYHTAVSLDFPVSIGSYAFPSAPEEPMALHMLRTPCAPGLPARDQHRLGRVELLQTPFSTFEQKIRDQLGRMFGPVGFDPDHDVEAITVNRWSHGYAYEYNSLFDPPWPEGQRPCERGRQRFGRIAIANADAEARAYIDAAIDQAARAVGELLSHAGQAC
jgi:spermidine dehydrogenase